MLPSTLAKSNRQMTFVVICWLCWIVLKPSCTPTTWDSGSHPEWAYSCSLLLFLWGWLGFAKTPSGVAYHTILCLSSHCNLVYYHSLFPLHWIWNMHQLSAVNRNCRLKVSFYINPVVFFVWKYMYFNECQTGEEERERKKIHLLLKFTWFIVGGGRKKVMHESVE